MFQTWNVFLCRVSRRNFRRNTRTVGLFLMCCRSRCSCSRKFYVQRRRGRHVWTGDQLVWVRGLLAWIFRRPQWPDRSYECTPGTSGPDRSSLGWTLCTTGRFGSSTSTRRLCTLTNTRPTYAHVRTTATSLEIFLPHVYQKLMYVDTRMASRWQVRTPGAQTRPR